MCFFPKNAVRIFCFLKVKIMESSNHKYPSDFQFNEISPLFLRKFSQDLCFAMGQWTGSFQVPKIQVQEILKHVPKIEVQVQDSNGLEIAILWKHLGFSLALEKRCFYHVLSIDLSIHLSVYLVVWESIYFFVCLSVCSSVSPSLQPSIHPSM